MPRLRAPTTWQKPRLRQWLGRMAADAFNQQSAIGRAALNLPLSASIAEQRKTEKTGGAPVRRINQFDAEVMGRGHGVVPVVDVTVYQSRREIDAHVLHDGAPSACLTRHH